MLGSSVRDLIGLALERPGTSCLQPRWPWLVGVSPFPFIDPAFWICIHRFFAFLGTGYNTIYKNENPIYLIAQIILNVIVEVCSSDCVANTMVFILLVLLANNIMFLALLLSANLQYYIAAGFYRDGSLEGVNLRAVSWHRTLFWG